MFNNTNIFLLLNKEITLKQDSGNSLLSKKFVNVVTKMKMVYILLVKESYNDSKVSEAITPIIEKLKIYFLMSY